MTSSRKHFGKMQKGVEVAGVLFFVIKPYNRFQLFKTTLLGG